MTAPAATTPARLCHRAGLEVLTWPAFDPLPVDAIVTTRHGGVSPGRYATLNLSFAVGDEDANVRENRSRVAAALGTDLAAFVFAAQVHGASARIVSTADRGRGALTAGDAIGPADVLVTGEPGTVLAILVADCVPVVLYDTAAHVLACVHAGWRGTVAHVVQAALAAMRSFGTRPQDVIAGIGPGVAPGCYQVGEEVAGAVRDAFGAEARRLLRPAGPASQASPADPAGSPGAANPAGPASPADLPAAAGPPAPGRWLLDLPAANRHDLRMAGVPDGQIQVAATPTGPDPGLFFSHRAERPCGRFALAARLGPRGQG